MTSRSFTTGVQLLVALVLVSPAGAQTGRPAKQQTIDRARLLTDLSALSADSMQGRRTGTAGAEMARRYLDRAFAGSGLSAVGDSFRRPFGSAEQAGETGGVNFVGRIAGADTGRVIVVTAHYDHLGVRSGQIYNGADDNASGVAALLAIARSLARTRPDHTILFVAVDAEERGLRGSRAFVADPPVARERIAINVNLDMVSRSDKEELYVAGTHHHPFLLPFVHELAEQSAVTLLAGHDRPGTGSDDWTGASDHGPFHRAGIPFLYFGVEDHPDYHRPTDDFERIDPDFYVRAVETIAHAVRSLDRELDRLVPASR